MSPNDIRNDRRLAPRALRIRNRCLTNLAEHHALPVPTEQDVAGLDETAGLEASWQQWEKTHAPVAVGAETPRAAPVKPSRISGRRLFASLALLGAFAAGVAGFKFFELWQDRQSAAANDGWLAVNDSTIAVLRGKLLALGGSDANLRISLPTVDVGSLIFGGLEPRARLALDSVGVKIDTLVWLRGRVRGASRFELGGRLRVLRSGHAQLHVTRMMVDGVESLTSKASHITSGGYAGAADRLQFALPAFVSDLSLTNGVVQLVTRTNGSRRARLPR